LVCANDRAVDDRTDLVDLQLERLEDQLPAALLRPIRERVVDRLPRAKPLGQVSPSHACLGAKEHGFDEEPVTSRGRWSRLLPRKDGLQASSLILGQRVSMHADF
jgi:hypothetical protein